MLNLDTHILIFSLTGALRAGEREALSETRWSISAIVLWELAKLIQLGRVDMDLDDRQIARVLNRLHVWPVDLDVARKSVDLDFRGDPADEIIAATSIIHNVPLITRDRIIRQSKMVPLAASDTTARRPKT
ncbi:MAG: type II toxin-antitoxin system VapC family toxin [Alphaproteobacteria bacterium]|nr:type II toxin-antitoxin system VapC family toxin [Alphaproteobacteria bacterium]